MEVIILNKGAKMKKIVAIVLLISCTHLYLAAMEEQKNALTFIKAQKDEDLSAYKEILLKVYPEYATDPVRKEALKDSLSKSFAVLTSWIGKKGNLFIKVLDYSNDNQRPVGFLTLEALNKDETHIAFHQSPLLPEYLDRIQQYFECAKKEFPHAKMVYTAASDKVTKMQDLIKKLGFVEDASYLPNKELVPNPAGFVGYKKSLE